MSAITTYFAMGGYAVFVWPAYALTAAAMIWLCVAYVRRLRNQENELKSMEAAGLTRRPRSVNEQQ